MKCTIRTAAQAAVLALLAAGHNPAEAQSQTTATGINWPAEILLCAERGQNMQSLVRSRHRNRSITQEIQRIEEKFSDDPDERQIRLQLVEIAWNLNRIENSSSAKENARIMNNVTRWNCFDDLVRSAREEAFP